jgi:hypothetical protein
MPTLKSPSRIALVVETLLVGLAFALLAVLAVTLMQTAGSTAVALEAVVLLAASLAAKTECVLLLRIAVSARLPVPRVAGVPVALFAVVLSAAVALVLSTLSVLLPGAAALQTSLRLLAIGELAATTGPVALAGLGVVLALPCVHLAACYAGQRD